MCDFVLLRQEHTAFTWFFQTFLLWESWAAYPSAPQCITTLLFLERKKRRKRKMEQVLLRITSTIIIILIAFNIITSLVVITHCALTLNHGEDFSYSYWFVWASVSWWLTLQFSNECIKNRALKIIDTEDVYLEFEFLSLPAPCPPALHSF